MQEKKFNLTKKALILAILFLVFHLILSFLRGELNFMVGTAPVDLHRG